MRNSEWIIVATGIVLGASACDDGLDRDEAARVIEARHFGATSGTSVSVMLRPAVRTEYYAGVGGVFTSTVSCGDRTLGWADVSYDVDCLGALIQTHAIESCGRAPTNIDGIGDIEPIGCDAVNPEGIRRPDGDDARRGWTFTFAEAALRDTDCQRFVQAGERNAESHHERDAVSITVSIPSSGRFGRVTGIADGADGTKVVEFVWTIDQTAIATVRAGCTGAPGYLWADGSERTARATLRHYDDGWRVESTDWGSR